jgi:NADH-quinone oxidoreductase subunit H
MLAIGEFLGNPLIRGLVGALVVVAFISLNVLFLTWLERKVIARVQIRYGPNRAGPFGLLQPVADTAKLLTKEDIVPKAADRLIFTLAPAVAFTIAVMPAISIPLAGGLIVTDLNVGIFYIIAVSSLATIPVIMAAWGSNNKYSLLGGMRAVAQSLSYEIPLVLSIVGVIALTGSMSMVKIVEAQKGAWFVLLQPLGFAVFYIAAVAEMGRIPFDLPESESELVSGFHTEYTGMKFALLLFAEYIHMIVATALIVILFLGGWNLPFITLPSIFQAVVFLAKMYIVILVLMWTRGTLPRVKINVMTAIGWKILIPFALLNIFITGILLSW